MIIGLTGRAGSGKDYTYKWLADQGYRVMRFAWADNLRREIEEVLADSMHLPALWDKPYPPEVRALLQWWGTDLRRKEDPDYWIKKMAGKLAPFVKGGHSDDQAAVITDVRFPNEAEALQRLGGTIIKIWAPTAIRKGRLGKLPEEHASEVQSDHIEADITLISQDNRLRGATETDQRKWRGLLKEL